MPAARLLGAPGRWLARRTLRGRLVAGLLATLFVACAAVGAVTYTHLHAVLIEQLDTQIQGASQRYGECLHPADQPPPPGDHDHDAPDHHRPPPGTAESCAQQQQQGTVTTAAYTSAGNPYQVDSIGKPRLAGPEGPFCRLTAAEERELARLPVNGQGYDITLAGYGQYRFMASHGPDGAILSGMPLKQTSDALHDVALAEVTVFAIALVLTGLIGTMWVRVSLRPLRRVAATATRVTELPLASGQVKMPERVPDAYPRTEVGQVGAALNRMLGHVEGALARREASENRLRRFAADASHELRTPLASIRGYAELARRHPGPVPDDVAHALSRVESESARMSVLVDELLLLAQLDAGRPLASEPVDLTRLAIDVTSDARAATADHRWQLELPDEPVSVRGDEHRLHQVLANLLSNAARHTPAGTTVSVALAARPPEPGAPPGDPGTVQVTVTDDGPGIPADLQPALFERFVRGDSSRSRAAGSTGLGLAIVDAVTAAHHGQVAVTSEPGRTQFTITLPRLAEPDPPG
ncbi:MAG TPA: HAMP domain-containing sensor histidine kinase [Streptosporangiaceae bacterium]|nr:HAMP domain-containing sensor histidine kinase [Streptosporangiaceae bacterium]